MANSKFYQFNYSKIPMLTTIAGTIGINADGSVGLVNIPGAKVTKTNVGEYTVSLNETYNAVVAVIPMWQAAAAVNLVPQIKSVDLAVAKTVVIRMLVEATPTDPSAVSVLHVMIMARNSSVAL